MAVDPASDSTFGTADGNGATRGYEGKLPGPGYGPGSGNGYGADAGQGRVAGYGDGPATAGGSPVVPGPSGVPGPAAMAGPPAMRPGAGGPPGMLAATADRERAIDVLKAGFAEGRLTQAEYNDRMSRAYAARTYGELGAIVADLPAGPLGGPAHYQGAWYPQPVSPPPATNSMAVAALVCGIGEFFTMGLTAIPAVIFGHVARRQVRQTGQRGDGMALAGLTLGWIAIGLFTAIVAGLIVAASVTAHTHGFGNVGPGPKGPGFPVGPNGG